MKMDLPCLPAVLVLLNILVAGAQRSDTSSPSQRRPVFCLEPPYQGPGLEVLPRFFFNTRSGLCEAFVFGGGKAKLNNFLTKEECTRVCSRPAAGLETQDKLQPLTLPKLEDEPRDKVPEEIEQPEDQEEQPEDQEEQPEDQEEQPEDQEEQPQDQEEQPEDQEEQPEDQEEQPEDQEEQPEDQEEQPQDQEEQPEDQEEPEKDEEDEEDEDEVYDEDEYEDKDEDWKEEPQARDQDKP